MSKLSHMPFYTADYLQDTRKLTLEQRGAYTDLLFYMWGQGGKLADNDIELASMLGLPVRKWGQMKAVLMPFLIRYGNDAAGWFLTQQRLQKEWNYVQATRARQSDKGKRSAEVRRNRMPTDIQPGLQPQGQPERQPDANRKSALTLNRDIPTTFLTAEDAANVSHETDAQPTDEPELPSRFDTPLLIAAAKREARRT